MDRVSMGGIHGVHAIRFQARARAPDLVLPPRETPRRYASMAQKGWKKEVIHLFAFADAVAEPG